MLKLFCEQTKENIFSLGARRIGEKKNSYQMFFLLFSKKEKKEKECAIDKNFTTFAFLRTLS